MLPPPLLSVDRTMGGRRHATALRIAAVALAGAVLGACTTAPKWQTDQAMGDLVATEPAPVAAADPATLPRIPPGTPRQPYRLGAGDELSITVWGPREIWQEVSAQGAPAARTVTVQDDGTVVLPLIRRTAVVNLTLDEALQRIGDAYRSVSGARFQVDASMTRFRARPVLVEGAVTKPGLAFIGPELTTVGEAIVGAGGGLQDSADASRGLLFRGGQTYRIDYQASLRGMNDVDRIALQPGDRIFFPNGGGNLFYVFGEVGQQGAFPIPPQGVTLLQALSLAKGPQIPAADMQAMYLVRPGAPKPTIYQFSLQQIMDNRDLAVAPGDRLFVPSTLLTDWERTLRQLFPVISGGLAISSGAN